jgi:hypothetical protein
MNEKLLCYPPIYRVPMHLDEGLDGYFTVRGKDYLTLVETRKLLGFGRKYIEEKVDGSPIIEEYGICQIFMEDCTYQHTIPYTELPRRNLGLDIWQPILGKFITRDMGGYLIQHIEEETGWKFIHTIDSTLDPLTMKDLYRYMNRMSVYNPGHKIEGIVIKNYDAGIFGKVVNPEFEIEVDASEHWSKKYQIKNKIRWS